MKKILLFSCLVASLALVPRVAWADATSTDGVAAIVLALGGDATSTAATTTPVITTSDFQTALRSVVSDTPATFTFLAEKGMSYSISFQCPLGISAPVAGGDLCKVPTNLGSFAETDGSFTATFKNEATTDQTVTALLMAADPSGSTTPAKRTSLTVRPPAALRASIVSFSLDENIVQAATVPAVVYSAQFAGRNIDTYQIRLECSVPTTVAGIRERLSLIATGAGGAVSSPSSEGDYCNVPQTASASADSFSFRLENSFKTPQRVRFVLQAYAWDGEKDVFGEEQMKEITVNAR